MAKMHVTPDGPAPCKAEKDRCPYGTAEEHFTDQAEAQKEYERRGQEVLNSEPGLSKKAKSADPKSKLTKREQELVEKNNDLLRKIVNLRSETGDVTYEDANPDRAQRRLQEALNYAEGRGNTHLADKLSKAKVLPSGAFKTEDGKRVNTDKVLKAYVANKHIESERAAVIAQMNEAVRDTEPGEKKFSVKTDAGSFSATVGEGLDQDEFDKLTAKQKAACSSPRESLNLDKARETLDPKTLHEVTSKSQVSDYVVGKEPDVGQNEVKADRNLKGDTPDEKIKSGLNNLSDFYGRSAETYGKSRDLKAEVAEGSDAIKSVASKHPGHTFAPARSQRNGALVTERYSVNSKKAKEMLSDEQLKSITVTSDKPDPDKARLALSDEQFGKIFKARKVSVRVTEAKG